MCLIHLICWNSCFARGANTLTPEPLTAIASCKPFSGIYLKSLLPSYPLFSPNIFQRTRRYQGGPLTFDLAELLLVESARINNNRRKRRASVRGRAVPGFVRMARQEPHEVHCPPSNSCVMFWSMTPCWGSTLELSWMEHTHTPPKGITQQMSSCVHAVMLMLSLHDLSVQCRKQCRGTTGTLRTSVVTVVKVWVMG